jgi:hypothetical protein
MRQRRECNSCSGLYFTEDANGAPYFHACPPEIITTRAVDDGTGKITVEEVRAPQPNPRDENLDDLNAKQPREKKQGAGFTPR